MEAEKIEVDKKPVSVRIKLFFRYEWWKILRELYLWINIFLMLFPLLFMIFSSLKTSGEFTGDPFGFPADFPGTFIENVKMVFSGKTPIPGSIFTLDLTPFITMLGNTVLVTFGSLILMIFCSLLAGYAIAKKRFRGKKLFIIFVLIIQIVPFFGYITPMYLFATQLKLTNSLLGLIPQLVGVSLPSTIVLMQGFYKTFPTAVEEAALIDGCGEFKKFIHIVLPMSRGIIASMAVINFMGYWNEVGISSLMLNDLKLFTISVGILSTNTQTGTMNYAYVMTLLTFSALPNLIFFTVFQKSITRGISLVSVKG